MNASPGNRRRWVTIITTAMTTLSGLAVLSVEACQEIQRARQDSVLVERKAAAGYDALVPAVTELQELATETSRWTTAAEKKIERLEDQVRALELQLARHEVYFDMLKQRSPPLRNAPDPTPSTELMVETFVEGILPKPKAGKPPTEHVPRTFNKAQQRRTE